MGKVATYSTLLILGLVGSQWLPGVLGAPYAAAADTIRVLTMSGSRSS